MGLGNDFWIWYIKHRQGNKRKIDGTTQTKSFCTVKGTTKLKAKLWFGNNICEEYI